MVNSVFSRIILAGSLIFSLSACTTTDNEGAMDTRSRDNNVRPYGVYDNNDRLGVRNYNNNRYNANRYNVLNGGKGTQNNIRNTDRMTNRASDLRANNVHQNTNIRESKKIADELVRMKEVKRANVLLTDNNAYIAVELAKGTTTNQMKGTSLKGTTNSQMKGTSIKGKTNNQMKSSSLKGTSMHGTRGSEYYGLRMNTGKIAGSYSKNNKMGTYSNNKMTTKSNNQVGTYTDTMENNVKNKITEKVKSMDKNVKNVYVSANADFVERVNNYMVDIGEGKPVRGFMEEFNTFMDRVFPMNVDNNNNRTNRTILNPANR
ncbi:YhcN/YlaJ family sporulation lipoprotein [Chengkuizengella axinellae]|uniref:YhcN/YlaJ family sporulation lipoprotein n=1 Tax=Chengkuizengella axinellae TaxID=3064388 RepID=A0ABT9IU68_9BACL|nr:YhcN/YlaJ family sporulation lipoprotein [Chengkuizengella sp. 2205SS18-9]MDP5272642.1 YhcN/YlaJ family sporulation lipoprotein [Chengkuizengella sp. 2205SS18-9]